MRYQLCRVDPRLFSYNSKHGWCPDCVGTGLTLTKEQRKALDDSQAERDPSGREKTFAEPEVEDLADTPCGSCGGARLNPVSRAVRFRGRSIAELAALSVDDAARWIAKQKLDGREAAIARDVIGEIRSRLSFLAEVGLGYLTLDRAAPTLSGGEAQRIRLAAQLGSNLQGVDLVVPKGQLTMLLGRNGAGKTTTLRTIMGLWQASKGAVRFAGRDITALHTPQIAGMNIAYVPENMGICADLTVKETMLLAARQARNAAQMDAQRLQWIFKLFPPVETFWNHPAGKLSGGQKQMVAVARAMVEPRDLLIIDEPSKGLAPAIINNMIEAFDQLKKSGVTICWSSRTSTLPSAWAIPSP